MRADRHQIENVIQELVKEHKMFTAFDVTKIVRKDIGQVKHSDVNAIVRTLYANRNFDGYLREEVNIGSSCSPFLYYHHSSDPTSYSKDWVENGQVSGTQIPVTSQSASVAAPVQSATVNDTVGFYPTKEGRVNVPLDLINKIVADGETVLIYSYDDKVVVQNSNYYDVSGTNLHEVVFDSTDSNRRVRFDTKKLFGRKLYAKQFIKAELDDVEEKKITMTVA